MITKWREKPGRAIARGFAKYMQSEYNTIGLYHPAMRCGVPDSSDGNGSGPLSAIEFHVLVVLAEGSSYGYAIMKAVAEHSGGGVRPEIGSLYRVLSRLTESGWVEETDAPAGAKHGKRGLPRRYYALTLAGRRVALAEARRLASVVALARERNLLPERGSR